MSSKAYDIFMVEILNRLTAEAIDRNDVDGAEALLYASQGILDRVRENAGEHGQD